jgi:phosphate transport system ATP-binding protein
MTTKLEARRLSVHYGKTRALHGVSLAIHERRVMALIGPSGCGKSTFLRALNRMHELAEGIVVSGEVFIDGEDLLAFGVDPVLVRRRIGMVFQRPNPFPASIADNVAFGLKVLGTLPRAELEARVEEALRSAALWDEVKDRLDESALSLSGGQQQRLCIARAVATRPEVLLMDEPASALDPHATEKVEELIVALKSSHTVVLVTHSMAEAARVSDDVAFFYAGEIVEAGAATEVLRSPREERTRAYLSGHFG